MAVEFTIDGLRGLLTSPSTKGAADNNAWLAAHTPVSLPSSPLAATHQYHSLVDQTLSPTRRDSNDGVAFI